MEISVFRDNELITGISILAVLRFTKKLELSKCMLIEPLLSYSKVLKLLKRSNSSVKSIEDLIIKESIIFSNFSSRYQEKLILSINSLLLFEEMGLLKIDNNNVTYNGYSFDFSEQSLGEKAKDRISASRKLAEILTKGEASDFYLSLRIEL
ncbi:hypothetical protein [Intestinimonas butyriciproducens]|uniref:hypothetical protein n=1 Tax=Intestinimonas butyriciproducens TaxID=1297617 RepID=UPI002431F183|nr:hypothetical protein [Intestinimonas butyriciproducens]